MDTDADKESIEEARHQFDQCQAKLDECEKLRDEYLAGWQRQKADFINFKNEQAKLGGLLGDIAQEQFVLKFLPVIDTLDIAFANLPEDISSHEWVKGIQRGIAQSAASLKALGIEEIPAMGLAFNPAHHEAVG